MSAPQLRVICLSTHRRALVLEFRAQFLNINKSDNSNPDRVAVKDVLTRRVNRVLDCRTSLSHLGIFWLYCYDSGAIRLRS